MKVATNGCFDLFHAGHANILKHCVIEAGGDKDSVYVFLNNDDSVRRLKGSDRPIVSQGFRLGLIKELGFKNVILFDTELDLENLIRENGIDTIVKDHSYSSKPITGSGIAHRVVFVDFTYDISSSSIVRKITDNYDRQHKRPRS